MLSPEDIKSVAIAIKDSQATNFDSITIILGFVVAMGTILGFGASIVRTISKYAAESAIQKKDIQDNKEDINNVASKYRSLEPIVHEHETKIELVEKDIEYLRSDIQNGIDDSHKK